MERSRYEAAVADMERSRDEAAVADMERGEDSEPASGCSAERQRLPHDC